MNFISWIFEHLYILIVIGFALVSFLGKSIQGTGRKSPPRKGMPTFGGIRVLAGSRRHPDPSQRNMGKSSASRMLLVSCNVNFLMNDGRLWKLVV